MFFFNRSLQICGLCIALILLIQGASPSGAQEGAPTYNKDILPILQKHCLSCHHKGGSAPQSLETYKDMRPWIRSTRKVLNEKSMPPWHADPAIGKWKNNPGVSDAEVKTIMTWVDTKAAEGDPKDAPAAIDFAKPWKLGQPDQILSAPEFSVPAQGGDMYRAFVLSPDFAQDTWVSSIEFTPGAPEAIQQMSVALIPTEAAKKAQEAGKDAGFAWSDPALGQPLNATAAAWNKGMSIYEPLPEGTGILIPKGSSLILKVHYKTTGDAVKDQSKVGLKIAKAAAAKELKSLVIENKTFEIPAEAHGHKVTAELKLDKAVKILAILPRMHYLGKTMELTATTPDGKQQKILNVTDYNYELQTIYTPAEQIALPAGTKIEATATYDNSKDNANNPNQTVRKVTMGPAPEGEVMAVVLQTIEG